MVKLSFLIAIVPISLLLTLSFFVLSALHKIEGKGLKAFGYVVVGFLWLAALVVFSGAVYKMAQGSVIMKGMMQPKMKTDYVPQVIRMQPAYLPGIIMPEKSPLAKDQKLSGCSKCQANKGVIFKAD